MPALRIKVAAQDAALRALRTAASAEPNKDVSAEIKKIADALAKRFGVPGEQQS